MITSIDGSAAGIGFFGRLGLAWLRFDGSPVSIRCETWSHVIDGYNVRIFRLWRAVFAIRGGAA